MLISDQYRKYLPTIKKHYTFTNENTIEVFADGWDYIVFVIDKTYALRFPRREDYVKKLPTEVAFLDIFAPQSPLPVPKLQLHHDNILHIPFVTYDFIQGVQFKKDVAATFSKEELLRIAKQIGNFLTVLHSFPLEEAKKLTIEIDALLAWQDRLVMIKQKVFPYVSQKEQTQIEKLFTDFFSIIAKSSITLRLNHGDIMPEHIIVDPEKHTISGIIDFGDIAIGDPAFDFTFLGKYGKDFLQEVYNNYTLPRDEYFETRRQFYEDRVVVTNLEHSIDLHDEEKIEIHKKELTNYITAHPL